MTEDPRIADLEARVDALEIELAAARQDVLTLSRALSPIITRYVGWLIETHRHIPPQLVSPLPHHGEVPDLSTLKNL